MWIFLLALRLTASEEGFCSTDSADFTRFRGCKVQLKSDTHTPSVRSENLITCF
jgi:hypothetical protein